MNVKKIKKRGRVENPSVLWSTMATFYKICPKNTVFLLAENTVSLAYFAKHKAKIFLTKIALNGHSVLLSRDQN